MFEQFTDRARKVMALANQESQRLNHEYIGTEHILLGLLKEGSGVGANVLKNMGMDLRKVRQEVEKFVKRGDEMVAAAKLPQIPGAKRVIEYAIEESRLLNHNFVGTEHLLLGLVREREGIAAQVMMNLGLKLEQLREEVLTLLGKPAPQQEPAATGPKPRRRSAEPTEALRKVFDETLQQSKSALVKGLEAQIESLQPAKDEAVKASDYERAAQLRNEQEDLRHRLLGVDSAPCATGHLLLAILAHPSCIAARALAELGVDTPRLREMVERMLREDPEEGG